MNVRRVASLSALSVVVLVSVLVVPSLYVLAAGDPPHPPPPPPSAAPPPPAAAPAAPSTATPPGPPPNPSSPSASPAPPLGPPTASEKTEEHYKNIQVLKGHPADQLVPAMQFISSSLGVDCDFCHVDHAPEKDDKKEKQTARAMIKMTAAINRDNFDGKREVTCNSCHHGASHPLASPAVATSSEPPPEEPEVKPEDLPSADVVLAKYLQSVGGVASLTKVTSRIQKGKITGFGGQPMAVEVFAKAPDKRISIVHTPRGDNITAFDGSAGWLGNTGRPPRDMSAAETDAARLDADFRFPFHVREIFNSFRVTTADKIDGRETLRVVARNEGQPPVLLFFDAQSGLLVRQVRYAETPLGRNPTQIDYADYRDADGVKIPFRWTVARPNGRFSIQIEEVQQNVPIEDGKFVKTAGS